MVALRPMRSHLAKQGTALGAQGIRWTGQVLYGNRATEIARYAAESGIDLIGLTSHRIELERPGGGWGTLSYKVGILAPCPAAGQVNRQTEGETATFSERP